jgi:hypothetical protein
MIFSSSLSGRIQKNKKPDAKNARPAGDMEFCRWSNPQEIGILPNQGSLLRERIILWWNSNSLDNIHYTHCEI